VGWGEKILSTRKKALELSVFDSNFVAGLNEAREATVSFSTDSLKVLTLIGRQGPISRTRIGRVLNFTPSRVTRLSDALLASNLIHEIGREESTGGRRSTLLALRENHHVLCGVGISYSSVVEVVLMDLRANILEEEKFVLPSETERKRWWIASSCLQGVCGRSRRSGAAGGRHWIGDVGSGESLRGGGA
jgi:DNA-binding MarR family transcriptional regulator